MSEHIHGVRCTQDELQDVFLLVIILTQDPLK